MEAAKRHVNTIRIGDFWLDLWKVFSAWRRYLRGKEL